MLQSFIYLTPVSKRDETIHQTAKYWLRLSPLNLQNIVSQFGVGWGRKSELAITKVCVCDLRVERALNAPSLSNLS